jgi:hypothetical protein
MWVSRASTAARLVRGAAARAAAPARGAAAAAAPDAEHAAWLAETKAFPVSIPHFEWTLEWMLPTPVPMHQFEQAPICIEVKDRNEKADDLVYSGPNVAGGWTHPETGAVVKLEVRRKDGEQRRRAARARRWRRGVAACALALR